MSCGGKYAEHRFKCLIRMPLLLFLFRKVTHSKIEMNQSTQAALNGKKETVLEKKPNAF